MTKNGSDGTGVRVTAANSLPGKVVVKVLVGAGVAGFSCATLKTHVVARNMTDIIIFIRSLPSLWW